MKPPLHAFEGFGIELEYMIVDRHSLSVMPIADRFLDEIATAPSANHQLKMAWSNELALHAIELKNIEPVAHMPALRPAILCEIQRANRVLAAHGAMLMPGGVHPWMNPRVETRLWSGTHAEIYATYHRIFNCFEHGWANLQSVQINLPFANDEEFARLHAAARLIAPIIPALAASSPVLEGQFTGFKDSRMHAYCIHQARVFETISRVIPDTLHSHAEYEQKVLAPMYQAMESLDPEGILRHEWLNVRAIAPRFSRNAIEIRNIDSQECAKADLAVAQAIAAVIRLFFESTDPGLSEQQNIDTDTLTRIHHNTIRDGAHALILEPAYLKLMRAPTVGIEGGALWRQLIFRAQDAGAQTDDATHTALCVLLNHGTLARRLLRTIDRDYSRTHQEAVWRQLCRCLQEDELFCPKVIQ